LILRSVSGIIAALRRDWQLEKFEAKSMDSDEQLKLEATLSAILTIAAMQKETNPHERCEDTALRIYRNILQRMRESAGPLADARGRVK